MVSKDGISNDKLKTSLMLILKFLEVKILQLYDTVHCSAIKVSRTDHIFIRPEKNSGPYGPEFFSGPIYNYSFQ